MTQHTAQHKNPKKLIAGNWKMNGSAGGAKSLAGAVQAGIAARPELLARCDFVICPPAPYIPVVRAVIEHTHAAIGLGGQDCSFHENGAYTGDISAAMLRDSGCRWVVLGHSERRQHHGEKDADIALKAASAHRHGLSAIICVGETGDEREKGLQEERVGAQLRLCIPEGATAANTVIAYEPVWAIGTGKNATPDDIAAMHNFIRGLVQEKIEDSAGLRILYGGSVKPANAGAIFDTENVDGALVGGASLEAEQFLGIAAAA
jgi:triosephosphate isomerase